MKLTIDRAPLLHALAHVQSVVERRNTIPILANVLIDAGDGAIKLAATDMDLTITEKIAADVTRPGKMTAPAHTLYDIVRKLPDGTQVELGSDGDDGKLMLRSGRSTFTLACLPASEYPATDAEDQPHNFSLTATELKGLVDHTRFAISTEETRYYLNGIYLHALEQDDGAVLRAVATDGHRLARFQIPLPDGAADIPGVIVPRKTIQELRKLLEDSEDSIDIALSETKIRFAFDGIVLYSKLIDGTFPDYERVIPSGNDKTLNVDCKQFAAAVDRVSTISTEKSRAIKLALNKNNLTLSATSLDNGSAVEEIEVGFDSEPLEIGFNSRYLLDITQQIEGGHVQFSLADAASPTVVTDTADASALYVLMPMRV